MTTTASIRPIAAQLPLPAIQALVSMAYQLGIAAGIFGKAERYELSTLLRGI